ncbi:MAG: tetratricopeptide repeat protein [Bilophila sp.]
MKEQYSNVDDYIADLKAEIAQNENCANHHYNLGVALLSKGDFMAAEESFLTTVRNSPHLAEAYVQLGGICLHRGDLDGCLRYNEEAANCRAKFPVPWGNIGFVHLQRGDASKAVTALKKALSWDPDFIQAMATLGAAYFMLGDYDASIEISNKAIAKEANFAPAWNNLSLAWFEKGDRQKAAEYATKAAELGFDVRPEYLEELKK